MRASIAMLLLTMAPGGAMALEQGPSTNFGPYNVMFLSGGIGIEEPLARDSKVSEAGAPWSFSGWMRVEHVGTGRTIVAALGDVALAPTPCRCLVLDQGRLALELGEKTELRASG